MGTDIGLGIQLRANAQGLQADLNKASKVVESWKGQMESIMSGGLKIAGVSAGLAVFKDLAAQFKEVKREADSVGASIQQLQGLKLFAKQDADAIVPILQRIQAELGLAADGSEEMRKKFPKWKELVDVDAVTLLKSLSAEYKTLTTQVEKAAFARKVGGRGQQGAVMAMLAKGPDAIEKGQMTAEKFAPWNEALERHATGWQIVVEKSKEYLGLLADIIKKGSVPKPWGEKNDKDALDLADHKKNLDAMKDQQGENKGEGKQQGKAIEVLRGESADFVKLRDRFEADMALLTGGKSGAAHAAIDKMKLDPKENQQAHLWEKQRENMQQIHDAAKEAARITEEARTPLEKLRDGIEQLEFLHAFAGLDEKTMDQATAHLLDQSGLGKTDQSLPPALQVGTAEAQRFLNQNEMGQAGNTVQDKIDITNALLRQLNEKNGGVAHL